MCGRMGQGKQCRAVCPGAARTQAAAHTVDKHQRTARTAATRTARHSARAAAEPHLESPAPAARAALQAVPATRRCRPLLMRRRRRRLLLLLLRPLQALLAVPPCRVPLQAGLLYCLHLHAQVHGRLTTRRCRLGESRSTVRPAPALHFATCTGVAATASPHLLRSSMRPRS